MRKNALTDVGTVIIQPASSSTFAWTITSQSFFNEDTGEIRVRLIHTLTADVLATDEITFEIGFTTTGDTSKIGQVIKKDIAQCQLKNNTMQPKFWNQYAYDSYEPLTGNAGSET